MGKEIRAFDLFCGGGGSSIGAKQAGVTPVGGVDAWDLATAAYKCNLPRTLTYTRDIRNLSPKRVLEDLGKIDLLIASPECTHHSVAKGNRPRDEESKQLAFQVIRYAAVLQPRWIVVENVIQMRTWHAFEKWRTRLTQLGYFIEPMTLDAQHYGVPQSRRRLYVVCSREQQPPIPRTYRRAERNVQYVLDRAHRGGWSYAFTPLNNGRRSPKTLERAERAISAVGKDQQFVMVYYGTDGSGGFQTVERPLRTITTLDRFALVRPNCVGHEMRMFQPPELALAMGFPENYRFPDEATRRDCIKLIGNAVCPPVMRAIVRSLVKST